jgi:hypothetical protein
MNWMRNKLVEFEQNCRQEAQDTYSMCLKIKDEIFKDGATVKVIETKVRNILHEIHECK